MMTPLRPRRSLLFVPAANARALEKSGGLAADALIYDLEDSAGPREKAAARDRLAAHLGADGFAGERIIRVNALDTQWGADDLRIAAKAGVDAVLLPKVETVETLRQAAKTLTEAGAPDSVKLWAMIETPLGILDVGKLAAAGSATRVTALMVGPYDIALSTGIQPGPDRAELMPWIMQIMVAAKAYGMAVLDGPYANFRDEAGFAAECAAGRRLGFDGKTLIHPTQIAAANAAYSPDPAAVTWAERIVETFAAPENADKGVLQIEGRMVERLHLKQAQILLAMRDAIAEREAAR
ncbi:CoA ester lyase [Aurantimonas sp. C2-6-R+9]|uniref:HpcH/HpaI aldolase/citrate lyase family protein n=1 Tax=unclassified Aurantimonas TaxID=2638230 RepID=UPI002E1949CF|nr:MULTISPECIES: CoA ester lyase [unclassified Aurantimonas]MEC5291406.1 CoA ester lyase [Aurantimonas sp. C2-3-R2]MEC5381138.1 CoA ester lyase [Aurantimonas sp. C2-6-R+9]MEC5412478.1 CoA ester lyase [Aurantimonas sp. C2-4-R8]